MDKNTHEVRLKNWAKIIEQCTARPKSMTVKQWCVENNIGEKAYYYWLRRIRQETYAQISSSLKELPVVSAKAEVAFAEIPIPEMDNKISYAEQVIHPAAVIKTNTFSIELSSDIPDRLLIQILQGVSHA